MIFTCTCLQQKQAQDILADWRRAVGGWGEEALHGQSQETTKWCCPWGWAASPCGPMPCCLLAGHLFSRCDVLDQVDCIGAAGKDLQGYGSFGIPSCLSWLFLYGVLLCVGLLQMDPAPEAISSGLSMDAFCIPESDAEHACRRF